MGKANRIIAVCVTAAMAFQMLAPAPEALAQETSVFANALPLVSQNTGDASDGSQDTGESDVQASASESESDAAESGGSASDDSQGTIGGASADAANGNTSVKKAASESEVATQADSGYAIMTVEGLKAVLGEGSVEFGSDGAVAKITVGAQNDKLLALSNTDPKLYQHATITRGTGTGAGLDVTGTVRLGSADYKFRGFGSDDYPFDGSFALGEETITLDKALFNNVKLTEDRVLNLVWTGTGSQPIVAKKIDGNGWTLKATVTTAATYSKTDTSKVKLTSPLLGDVAGSLALEATYGTVNDKPLAIDAESSSDNIGLLANAVAKRGSLSVSKFEGLPEKYEGTPTIKTTADGKNAGGLIGECESGATVAINDSVDLSQFTVAGKNASGGFIGKAADLTLNIGPNVVVKPARTVGDADSSYSGGIIGDVRFAGSYTVSSTAFSFDDVVTLGARYRAGCLFGRTDISNGDITVQGGTYKSQLTSGDDGNKGDPKTRGSYGGLVGNVFATSKDSNEALRAFIIKKGTDGNKVAVEFDHKSALCYAGGVAGYVGDKTASDVQPVAVVLDGVSVACKGDASARQSNGRYGGAVGVVDMYDVLDVRDFSLASDKALGDASQQRSAGIAGSAWIATIKFSGITDLSGAAFAENVTTGQLVNENYNSLIFADGNGSNGKIEDDGTATGWTLRRPNSGSKADDLATYGEVVRLGKDGLSSELLKLDSDTHILTKAGPLAWDGSACTLADKNDFAKLAITWQTNGYYSMVQGITPRGDDANDGLGNLPSSTITVTSTIDLSGTGLTGLTKDRVPPTNQWEGGIESSQLFSGKLTGDGTINLAVGEPYGMRGDSAIGSSDSSAGNGKIYRHGRLGLFGGVTTNAVVENVTVGGFMRFENGGVIDAGAVAGTVAGAGATAFSGVKITTNVTYTSSNGDNALQIGGIAGSVSAAATVDFSNNATAQAAIAADGETQGETRVGGAIGCVAAEATPTLNVTGLKIGGSITAESESKKVAQIGGFIGSIGQGASGVRKTVNITGLAFDGFAMNVGTNGDAKNGAGGLLGYSWGNAIVTIGGDANSNSAYALTTNDTSVTANGAAEFGGLLYVMSGHLVINDYALDLSNASLSAASATSFGVLLARSGVSDANRRFGAEDAYSGLYLEDRAEWATAYKVPDDRKISAGAVTYFDEWVAATTRPGSTTMNGECNGLISLHTVGEKLYMGSDAAQDNSYQNRTDVGKQYKTNQNARYYYNLDRCLTEASPSGSYQKGEPLERGADSHKYWIKSPQALMIWSACRNSPSGLYGYIAPGLNFNTGYKIQIGNADSSLQRTNLDLDGYSYYPVDVSGELKVLNTNISFHYTDIKNEQRETADKKSNAAFTQHANMHLALFRVVFGAYQVENVNLAGSVGCVVNDSDPGTSTGNSNSGALFCRAMSGKSNGIIQASLNNVVLDGLTVDGANQKKSDTDPTYIYAPLLMNDFTSYVTLDVQNLSVKEGSYGTDGNMEIAASSLFGKFGTGNSNQVNASFHDNVELPSGKNPGVDGIFTRASFFDSFGYGASSTGSANYIFNNGDRVTYGAEIDSTDGTETDKQLWYNDAPDYGDVNAKNTDEGKKNLVTDGEITATKSESENPQFGTKYLPYVYNRQKDESGNPKPGYREIKVNQHPAHLVTGCGTYSDPYVVKNAHELYTLANYINSANSVVDGWQVTVTTDQSQTCTRRSDQGTSYEATYEFSANGRQWKKVAGSSGPIRWITTQCTFICRAPITVSNQLMMRPILSE